MILRKLKQYFAIRNYVQRLSQDLARRFGMKNHYSLEQVSKAVGKGGFSQVFIAYAHATFCNRNDFDDYYGSLGVTCTYDGLRNVIATRYLSGALEFNAMTVINAFKKEEHNHFGENSSTSGPGVDSLPD